MSKVAGSRALRRLARHVTPRRRGQLVFVLALMLAGALAELFSLGAILPFLGVMSDPAGAGEHPYVGPLFRWLGWSPHEQLILPMATLFGLVVLFAGGVRVLLTWVSNKFVFMLSYDLGIGVYRQTLNQPYRFYVSRNTSSIIAGINNVQVISAGVLLPLMQVVTSAVIALFILAALLMIDAGTAIVAGIGFSTIYAVVTVSMRRRLHANSVVIAKAQAERVQVVQEGMGSIRNVLLDDTQNFQIERFASVEGPLREAQSANSFIGTAPRYIIESTGMVLIALLAYGLSLEPGGVSTALPVLGAMALGAQKLLPLLQTIYYGWTRVAGSWAVIEDVIDLLELPTAPELATEWNRQPLPFERSIRLEDVHFRYGEDGATVLKGVNLVIPKGARCGLIGTTGSGKSTAVDLIMGLLEPSAGKILVDDRALGAGTVRAWRARVSHVPQAIYLADTSMKENIALGTPASEVDMERVKRVAVQAQIADFIDSLPQGYDSLVGERGVRLSGGQRQRIGIARALYKSADVLVLDEATSALDDVTEKAVIECIDGLQRDMTVVIIAHRLSTVRNCDIVVRLENGVVMSQGTFEDVVGTRGEGRPAPT